MTDDADTARSRFTAWLLSIFFGNAVVLRIAFIVNTGVTRSRRGLQKPCLTFVQEAFPGARDP